MRLGRAAAALWLVAAAACKPSTEGMCAQDADCPTGSACSQGGVCIARPPEVSVEVRTSPDAAGWFSRTGADLDVAVQVTRGGADAIGAQLAIPACAAATCTFVGVPVSGGFEIAVPRQVQAQGSAAPLQYQVTVVDRAGNQGLATGTLRIDDAAPQIGASGVISPAGIAGEDGQSWYAGSGNVSNTIELSVPVTDPGTGIASIALHVNAEDVKSGTPLDPAPLAVDGGARFQLPAYAVNKQLPLRFTITATDALGHVARADGSVPVDGVAPVVTELEVVYASAAPADACASGLSCGRQGSTRLLRDDAADVTFDVTDCGAGVVSPPALTAGGQAVQAVEVPPASASTCANGNRTHHFKARVDFGAAAISAPDAAGTVTAQLAASAADATGNAASAAGSASLSLWRWKRQLPGPATGAPVLLAGPTGARSVAIGTANAVTALASDGSQAWTQAVSTGADLALGPGGTIYAVSTRSSCANGCSGTLSLVTPGASAPVVCTLPNVSLGAPPAVTTANRAEAAVVVATAHAITASANLFVFAGGCSSPGTSLFTPNGADLTGVSAAPGRVFVSHPAGFTTLDQSGTAFNFGTITAFNQQVSVSAAPAVLDPAGAVFGTEPTDEKIYRAGLNTNCGAQPCWTKASGFTAQQAGASLPFTPLYDSTSIYAADAQGNLFAWSQQSGLPSWSHSGSVAGSAPTLLHDKSLLVVQADGAVNVVGGGSATTLLAVGAFSGGTRPVAPAIDTRGPFGVAYVVDGAGWVYAVQLPVTPEPASSTAWTRPGRDSCNSRTAGAACP
jgi:hypothetical protein